jgi:chaperone required for assembly of F1-ATPase
MMRRFYKLASIHRDAQGYGVALDGKPVRTPGGRVLAAEQEELAEAALREWAAQDDHIRPDTMPVNQILITSLDEARDRTMREAALLGYLHTDLLFYRSDREPYAARQKEIWGRWTDWFATRFAVPVATTTDLQAIEQDGRFGRAVGTYIENLSPLALTVFESVIEETSSLVLTIAFFERAATADDLYAGVFLEDMIKAELYDEEKYGAAPDQEKKRAQFNSRIAAAATIRAALKV